MIDIYDVVSYDSSRNPLSDFIKRITTSLLLRLQFSTIINLNGYCIEVHNFTFYYF